MPLPHPHGYEPPRQTRVDRRRVLLAGVILSLIAAGLLVLGRRAFAFFCFGRPVFRKCRLNEA